MLHRLSLLLLLLCSAIVAPHTLTVYKMKALGNWTGPFGNADGFVKVYYNHRHFGTTVVKNYTDSPVWEESFSCRNASYGGQLKIIVYNKIAWYYDHMMGYCVALINFGKYQHYCYLSSGGQLEFRYCLE